MSKQLLLIFLSPLSSIPLHSPVTRMDFDVVGNAMLENISILFTLIDIFISAKLSWLSGDCSNVLFFFSSRFFFFLYLRLDLIHKKKNEDFINIMKIWIYFLPLLLSSFQKNTKKQVNDATTYPYPLTCFKMKLMEKTHNYITNLFFS